MKLHWPSRFIFQWHITDRCNQNCIHCYGESEHQPDISFQQLTEIYQQYLSFLQGATRSAGRIIPSRLVIAGGEPLVREDCIDFLDLVSKNRALHCVALLTNGTLIDEPLARYLGRLRPAFVQISIEGGVETHDRIRGKGNHAEVVKVVELLVRHKVRVSISFTARADNYTEFPSVVSLGRSLKVHKVWTDRMIPCGQSTSEMDQVLDPAQTREYISLICSAQKQDRGLFRRKSIVSAERALQFRASGHTPYACSAGDSLVTILSDGTLVPCRRMPIPVGNILERNLTSLYHEHPLLQVLRTEDNIPDECRACSSSINCRGGLRCLSYAMHQAIKKRDPGCWTRE